MMTDAKLRREKLQKIITNDLYEWFKETYEDAALSVADKIRLSQPFSAAIPQLEVCVEILRQIEARA